MIRALALMAALLPGGALACACCAEHGERHLYALELGDWEASELGQLGAATEARLFVTNCGLDCVSGIDDPKLSYPVEIEIDAAEARFDFGAAGELRFEMPRAYTRFAVDTDPTAEGGQAPLYTEMWLSGTVSGTGDFAAGGGAGDLVLSGTGNLCFDAARLTHWRLDVTAAGVSYRLYGALALR